MENFRLLGQKIWKIVNKITHKDEKIKIKIN